MVHYNIATPYPKWYDLNAHCEFHNGILGHSIENFLAFKRQVQVLLENGKWEFDPKSRSTDKDNVGGTPKEGHQFKHGIQVDKLKQERDDLSRDLNGLRADYQELCLVFKNADMGETLEQWKKGINKLKHESKNWKASESNQYTFGRATSSGSTT
ncbi:hypothetical protein GQ457_04G017850 [Hibiscus cannabinus]